MDLIVCPHRQHAVYLLSYIQEFGQQREFHIIIPGLSKIPTELLQMAATLNTKFISEDEVSEYTYEFLIAHSIFLLNKPAEYFSIFHYKFLSLYGDAMANRFYGLPSLEPRLTRIIFFGVELQDKSFESLFTPGSHAIDKQVVTWKQLGKTWAQLLRYSKIDSFQEFEKNDFVLIMRYWGFEKSQYRFKPDKSSKDYLKEEFLELSGVNRVIFRSHPTFKNEITKMDLIEIFGKKVEIILWEEVFPPHIDFPELSEPESIFWSASQGPKFFFSFDSSLSLMVSQLHPKSRVVWPNKEIYQNYFRTGFYVELVGEQIEYMQQVSVHKLNEMEHPPVVRVEGAAIDRATSIMVFESWRDALTQERDALTQERDALTQERDALTQERDALTKSTIWRSTRFLRNLISKIKGI